MLLPKPVRPVDSEKKGKDNWIKKNIYLINLNSDYFLTFKYRSYFDLYFFCIYETKNN